MAFWDAVVGKEEHIMILFEVGFSAFDEGVDIAWIIKERLKGGMMDLWSVVCEGLHDTYYYGFVAGHGILGVHGHDVEVSNAVFFNLIDCTADVGFAVAHS